jgi:hypothetical protein
MGHADVLTVGSRMIVLGVIVAGVSAARPRATTVLEETRTAVIHYLYFDRQPIIPYTVEHIEKEPNWRYELSREDIIELYRLLRNPGNRSAFSWQFTRLIVDKNAWGPRALVEADGHVKLGLHEYRLTADQVAKLRKFIFARIPPP